MIKERTPGEKQAYLDGFNNALKWFESRQAPMDLIDQAWALYRVMEESTRRDDVGDE